MRPGEISPVVWIVLAACAVAAFTDLRSRRVPNGLSLGLAVVVLLWAGFHGIASLATAAAIYAAVTLLGFIAFSCGWLGGGDVKLAAASAAAFGYPGSIEFLIYVSLGGGVLALAVALGRRRLAATAGAMLGALRPLAYRGVAAVPPRDALRLPYACAIALGAATLALANSALPFLRLPL